MASSPRSSSLFSPLQTIPLLLLGGLLLVAGCDSSVDLQQDDADPTARTVPDDSSSLALTPMPTGSELLTPGEPAPKSNADASTYGCYLAARPYSDEVVFHSRYLHFPEEVVEAASGQTRDVAYRVRIVPELPPTAGISEGEISEEQVPETSKGVRFARCIIPDVDGAEALAREQVMEHGEAEAIAQSVEAEQAQAGGGTQTPGKSSGTTCVVQEARTCILNTCWVEYHLECDSYGSGGGLPPAGYYPDPDEPGPDDPAGGGGAPPDEGGSGDGDCTQKLPEPGSDCEPIDPCESDNPPEHCGEDEDVKPCSEVEFNDDDLQEIMEALEEEIMSDAWEDSNPDADDQADRQEQFYWIIEEDGELSFKSASETSDVTYYPTSVSGVSPSDKPENAVGTFHTHPFEDDEVITSEEIIEKRLPEPVIENKGGIDELADPNSGFNLSYGAGPSDGDYINSHLLGDDLTHLVIDEGGVYEYQYDGEVDMDDPELDDNEKSSTDYERCGY